MLLDTHRCKVWAFPHFEREVLKAQKRSICISLYVEVVCMYIHFHPINAFIAIKCYKTEKEVLLF